MKAKSNARAIRVEIACEVLESVFEECDRYDREETGGRVIGHFALDAGSLVVAAAGVIEPGPNARRSPTSFFQDGDYQTEVFRRLEAKDPSIEHLGNWHTHHMNGYPTLSSGDVETYRRIVNHQLHNLDFFYALLVTNRNEGRTGLDRYALRHYVLVRGENYVHEIGAGDVQVTDEPRIWPRQGCVSVDSPKKDGAEPDETRGVVGVRALDKSVLKVLCPSFEPRLTARTGTFFWKGALSLVDGSAIEVRVVEVGEEDGLYYYPVLTPVSEEVGKLCERPFRSAWEAVRALELQMNREIYDSTMKDGEG